MPSQCFLIGYGRKSMSDDDFKKYIYGSMKNILDDSQNQNWSDFCKNLSFQAGSYDLIEDFLSLKSKIDELEKSVGIHYSVYFTFLLHLMFLKNSRKFRRKRVIPKAY